MNYILINYAREIVKGFTPSPEDLRTNGRAQSIFVTSKDDQLLVDYGPRICGYIYWAQKQAGIPITFSKDASSKLITRLTTTQALFSKRTTNPLKPPWPKGMPPYTKSSKRKFRKATPSATFAPATTLTS